MIGWKLTTNRKKIQRHINKVLRDLNKNIKRDELWLGRFHCRQIDIEFYPSEDHTYMHCCVGIEFNDRKTGYSAVYSFRKEDFMMSAWRVWAAMNNFIVEDCDVWIEKPRPSIKNPWDYRKER